MQRGTPRHAARPLDMPKAPKRQARHIAFDNQPIYSSLEFMTEIEAAQDPETPITIPRRLPPALSRKVRRRTNCTPPQTVLEFMRALDEQ
jgi:hypothetical protein